MSIQLKLDEMTEALRDMGHPRADFYTRLLESTGTQMAADIAAALDIEGGEATDQGTGFAGICAPFQPRYKGQECPDVIAQHDDGAVVDWEEAAASDELPPLPAAPAPGRAILGALRFVEGFEGDELQEGIDGPDGLLVQLRNAAAAL